MNVFTLFENNNVEDIKLGLQVIKCLGAEKEFKEKMEVTFGKYENLFNSIVLRGYKNVICEDWLDILEVNFDLTKLNDNTICYFIYTYPDLIDYFDFHRLDENLIIYIIKTQPQLFGRFDINKLSKTKLSLLFNIYPDLKNKRIKK